VGGERGPKDALVLGERITVERTELLQQTCRTLDVCEQERDGTARQLDHDHSSLPQVRRKRAGEIVGLCANAAQTTPSVPHASRLGVPDSARATVLATFGTLAPGSIYLSSTEIRTRNLLLRQPRSSDLKAVAAACQDVEISRFIPFIPVPYDIDDAKQWLEKVEHAWTESKERTFAIIDESESEPFQGVVTARLCEGGTVGYWLAPWGPRARRHD
jgi:Acetyltransferase (GNAT) domain